MTQPCIGIDVGGPTKGLHAVALRQRCIVASAHLAGIDEAVQWVLALQPCAVAIDAPCAWAHDGRSRACERTLEIHGDKIACFSTPTAAHAADRRFYDWVRHGLALFAALDRHFTLYAGSRPDRPVMCETFPQAVACHLAGCKVPARGKARVRRRVLRDAGIDPTPLGNIDLVDAALCAVTAEALATGKHRHFGDPRDGFIVVPAAANH